MKKINRKDFLKIGGGAVAGGVGGYVLSGAPFWGAQWLVEWTQDQYVPPKGLIRYIDSVNKNCPNGCEVSVRLSGNRAVRIESRKEICPLCRNTLQLLYHPERITSPLKRDGKKGSGSFKKISWDQAYGEISGEIDKLTGNGKAKKIAAINRTESLSAELMEKFIHAAGSRNIYYESSRRADETAVLGGYMEYDFDKADFVLSFGARIAEHWDSRIDLGKKIGQWKENKTRFIQADSMCTRTASMADTWLPVKPDGETALALGIAAYLIKAKKKSVSDRNFSKWNKLIQQEFSLSETSMLTGIPQETIKKTADEFYRAKNPIAVCGRGGIATTASSLEITAVYLLNLISGTKAVSLVRNPSFPHAPEKPGLENFIETGEAELIFLNESNPLYRMAGADRLSQKLENATVISLSPIMNESARYADYILPTLHFLETGKEKVTNTENDTRDSAEIITSMATFVKKTAGLFKSPAASYRLGTKTQNAGKKFTLKLPESEKSVIGIKDRSGDAKFNLKMIPFEVPLVGDGDGMAFPYVLKSIGPEIFYRKKFYVHINRDTAKREKLDQDDCITLESAHGKLKDLYVNITDIVAPGVVAVPLGFGHTLYTKYGTGKGANIREIMNKEKDPVTGSSSWWATPVKIG